MAFTVLQLHPFRGPRGDRLLLYFLIDGDGWEFVVFSIGGLDVELCNILGA